MSFPPSDTPALDALLPVTPPVDESTARLTAGTGTFGDALVAMCAGRRVQRPWSQGERLGIVGGKPVRWDEEGHEFQGWSSFGEEDEILATDWRVLP